MSASFSTLPVELRENILFLAVANERGFNDRYNFRQVDPEDGLDYVEAQAFARTVSKFPIEQIKSDLTVSIGHLLHVNTQTTKEMHWVLRELVKWKEADLRAPSQELESHKEAWESWGITNLSSHAQSDFGESYVNVLMRIRDIELDIRSIKHKKVVAKRVLRREDRYANTEWLNERKTGGWLRSKT